MPKRRCPFGETFPHQWKMHIGKKEVEMGVRREELMKNVYEKTREMLFKGASRSMDVNENHVLCPSVGVPGTKNVFTTKINPEPGQLYINSSGHLMTAPSETAVSSTKHQMPLEHTPSAKFSDVSISSTNIVHPEVLPTLMTGDSIGFAASVSAMDCDILLVCGDNSATGSGLTYNTVPTMQGVAKGGSCGSMLSSQSAVKCSACQSCRKAIGIQRWMFCNFCEQQVCNDCVRKCEKCTSDFCQLCSVLNYEETMERAFCLGCNG